MSFLIHVNLKGLHKQFTTCHPKH